MKHFLPLSINWLMAIMSLRPKHWKSAAVDDSFVAVASEVFLAKGGPLDEEDCNAIETASLEKAYKLSQELGDVPHETRYFIPADEEVDITDVTTPWVASMRRPSTFEHVLSSAHVDSAKILSEEVLYFNKDRFASILERRKLYPVAAAIGQTRGGYLNSGMVTELSGLEDPCVRQMIGNFDPRPRKYPIKGNGGLLGGPGNRHLWDSAPYAFDSMVKFLFEDKILKRQFNLSPEKALQYGRLSDVDCMMRHGEALWRAVNAYKLSLKDEVCHYWAEIDLMGSGPTNGSAQLNDQGLFRIISDYSHDDHIHVRMLFADHLCNECPSLRELSFEDMDRLLKLVLSPLQYGAGVPGTYNGLTGLKWDEDEEVDWDLFVSVNKTLRGMFPTEDAEEFALEVYNFAKFLYVEYCKCFSRLKAAMDAVTKAYGECLEAGQIPTYTSFSGQVNYGPVAKRAKTTTHWAQASVLNEFGKTVSFKAKVSDKKFAVKDIKSCAFSWFLHGIDAEIITLFTILAHEAGIPHYTNHDAVFIRLCDWHEAQRIMAHCIITVGAYKVFKQSGWDTVEMVSDIDCHWETETPEVLV